MNEIFYKNGNNMNMNVINDKKSGKSIKTDKKGGMINVCGIILCGNGTLKTDLHQSPFLKHYISSSILDVVEVNYGGKAGFDECLRKCANLLKQNELEKENKLIEHVEKIIANNDEDRDGCIVSIGFKETLKAIPLNAIKYIVLTIGNYKYAVKLIKYKRENEENKDNDGDGDGDDGLIIEDVQFAKNEIELKKIKKEMFEKNGGNNSYLIEVEGFMKYFNDLCIENNIELKTVGVHSPITQQFAKGYSGCIGVFYSPFNLQQYVTDDDDDDDGSDGDQDDDQRFEVKFNKKLNHHQN